MTFVLCVGWAMVTVAALIAGIAIGQNRHTRPPQWPADNPFRDEQ
jgi:hypothetical protein